MIIALLIVIGAVVIIYLLKHDARNANIANQNLTAVGHNLLLVGIEQQLLVKHLGAKKAAIALLEAIENNVEAYSILERLYEQAGLRYNVVRDDAKSRTIVLRTLATHMQNVADTMDVSDLDV